MGLVLTAFDMPSLESPPTNSLPPRRCPRRCGVKGTSSCGVSGGVLPGVSLRPEESSGLKLKDGSWETVLRCAARPDCAGDELACTDDGLTLSLPACLRRADAVADGCMGNEKSGLGIISIVGPPGIAIALTLLVCLPWPGATTSAMLVDQTVTSSRSLSIRADWRLWKPCRRRGRRPSRQPGLARFA